MDKPFWIWISLPLLLVLVGLGLPGVTTNDEVPPSWNAYHKCRGDNVTFTWHTNITKDEIYFVDVIFEPHDKVTSNLSNSRFTFASISRSADGDFIVDINYKYLGRISHTIKGGTYSFTLVSVSPTDRGFYELLIAGKDNNFEGKSDLIVYAEDNLWPTEDKDPAVQELEVEEEDVKQVYSYTFVKHEQSPVIGMKMAVVNHPKISDVCQFDNSSRCRIEFMREELAGLSGTVRFDVEPQLGNNAIQCHTVSLPYDYKLTIVQNSLSSALVGGICVSVFIAIAACVIPPVIIYVKKNKDKYLPLKGGYNFLSGCIERIEATPDISDVYRKNANSKMIHPHIQAYFQDPKAREGFFQDEGLTKIYFAAFIKHYITNVTEPLLPLDYVKHIKSDDGEFDVASAKNQLTIKKGDNRKNKYRKRILRLLFQHFYWFRERKIQADGSDSEETSPSKILTTSGLVGLLAMNFDRTHPEMDMQEFNRLARLARFLKSIIIHSNEIFGSREDHNGSAVTGGSMDLTLDPLLDSEA